MARGPADDDGGPGEFDSPSAAREIPAESGIPAVCRYLLIPGSAVRYGRPDRDHRCLAVRPHESPAQDKQRRLCLTSDHVSCPAFLAARQRRIAMLADSGITAAAVDADRQRPLTRTNPLILEGGHMSLGRSRTRTVRDASGESGPARARLTGTSVDRRVATSAGPGGPVPPRGWRTMAGPGVALIVVVAALAVLAARLPGAAPAAADTSPSPAASVVASASPAAPSRPATTTAASAQPSPPALSPSPSVAVSAVPSPTPAVSPTRTYRVRAGDTLSAIAARYGVSVTELQQLNNIKDPRFLQIGQVLRIP